MPKQQKTSKSKRMLALIASHKLIIFLILLTLIFPTSYTYGKFKDWDNAQLIKGLARDFPALVADIEQATGLDLEIKSNCSTTTEKFSNGVKTCEVSVAKATVPEKVEKGISAVTNSPTISSSTLVENKRGFEIKYRNKNSCTLSNGSTIYLSCITAVREANIKLAQESFSNIN